MSKESNSNSGVGIFSLLGILFVGLKLTGHIDWSWWFVTLPFWGGIALILLVACGIFIYEYAKLLYYKYYENNKLNNKITKK